MILTLYRGDADKIKEFEFKKTSKWCLLGQGIYLTDSLRVANSYRAKGSGKTPVHNLFTGQAENRTDAIEKSFPKFCETVWINENGYRLWYSRVDDRTKRKHEDKCRPIFRQLVEDKEITAEYTTAPVVTTLRGKYIKPSSTIAHQKELDKIHKRYLKVQWVEIPDAGFVTRFQFEQQKFDPFVLNVDTACNDEFFWTLMYDANVNLGKPADLLEDFVRMNKGKYVFNAVEEAAKRGISKTDLWRKIGNVVKPYGYVGYEYNGGMRLGGGFRHRAFCLWDADFVNEHKIERFK